MLLDLFVDESIVKLIIMGVVINSKLTFEAC